MAQAQVVLTAVDRTQAAINSAMRGMKSLEKTAKATSKVVNLAFALVSGTAFTAAFNKISEATAKTTEGSIRFTGELKRMKEGFENLTAAKSGVPAATDAMIKLNETLRDPQLVAAADAITSALLIGFAKASNMVLELAKNIRQALVITGVSEAVTPEEQISVLRRQLAELRGGGGISMGMRNPQLLAPGQDEKIKKQEKDILDQIAALELLMLTEVKLESRRRAVPGGETFLAPGRADIAAGAMANFVLKMEEELRLAGIEFNDQLYNDLQKTAEDIADSIPELVNEPFSRMTEFAKQAAASIQSSFADFLFDPFENGLKGMLSGFLNVIRRMIAEVAASTILNAIFGSYANAGGVIGTFAKAVTGRAIGGPVMANKPYVVGERGPELFVPGTSGGIMPNNKLSMGGGVTVAPVYNIDARGATADLQKALPGILQENNRRIFDELDRRYGIGR